MKRIRELLQDIRPEYDFTENSNFIDAGMLDSFDVVTLVNELDEMFGISIDGADIIPYYFSSLEKIKDLVQKNGGVF